jgi:opacity protein-like surface antigen
VRRAALTAALLAGLAAGLASPASAQDVAFKQWGLRAGASDDPDQFVAGAQLDFGEIIPNLRLQPHFDLGLGDDHTLFTLGVPVHYLVPVEGDFTVYGGGGLALAWVDRDVPRERRGGEGDDDEGDDTEFEIAPLLAGGVEWPAGAGDLSLELDVSGGDLPSLKLMLGWMF